MTEPSETAETPTAGRGRPRPETTIERDAKVLEYLRGQESGVNRANIVAGTELPGNEVYLSLYRLKRDGKIVRDGGTWKIADAVPAE